MTHSDPRPPAVAPLQLEAYRAYLRVLARTRVQELALRDRIDLSGVIQQTLLEAHQQSHTFRGTTPAEVAAWLRRILANNLADALRSARRAKRDVASERSLERELERSSVRLGALLATDDSSPSRRLRGQERGVLLAAALAELPDAQREVLLLRHWHGWPLARIAEHLGRTPPSVVGLLQRGLRALRHRLEASGERGDL